MRKTGVLITGAGGEIGRSLIEFIAERGEHAIVAVDFNKLDPEQERRCASAVVGDILDRHLLQRLVSEFEIHRIYHLAALLSTRAEYTPVRAHHVNVGGTLNLLELAHDQARWHGEPVRFLFPSSIAAYGLPSREVKASAGAVTEDQFDAPITMYGCNKLYCEHLGRYYSEHYRQLAANRETSGVDFRALRFPGLISAQTLPSGGTSDYAPEMIHAAARGEPYACFVEAEAALPFLAMPDAVRALMDLAAAPAGCIRQRVYNVGSFSLDAGAFRDRVLAAFPDADISFAPDPPRSAIVASWPADIEDSAARRDWGWSPDYDLARAFDDYFVPGISGHYSGGE